MNKILRFFKSKQVLFSYSIHKKDFLAIAFLVFLTMVFFWKFFFKGLVPIPADIIVGLYYPWLDYNWGYAVGVPVKNHLISDVVSQFYLWKHLAIEIIKNGQWPLWNPFSFSGTPLLATFHSATLYPLNVVLFLNQKIGWGLYIAVQPLLAMIFMYLYLRVVSISKISSIFGAIVFAFSGLSTTWLEFGTAVHAILWLPLILFSTEKFLLEKKSRWIILSTFSWLFLILAGHFQIAVYSTLIFLFYVFFRILAQTDLFLKRSIIFLAASPVFFGLLLSSIQILPSIELFSESIRKSDFYIREFNFGILLWQNLITFFAPDFFGHPSTRNYWGFWNYHEVTGYAGILTIIFSLLAFIRLKNFSTRFFTVLLVLSFLFIFPTPLAKIPYILNIPGLGTASASRALFVTGLCFSVLAALGMDRLEIEFKEKSRLIFYLISGCWLIFAFLFVGILISLKTFQVGVLADINLFGQNQQNLQVAMRNLIFPSFVLFSGTIALILGSRVSGNFVKILLVGVIIFDLFRFGWKYNPFVSSNFLFPSTAVTNFLQSQKEPFRIEVEKAEIFPSNFWIAYKLQSASGYDPIYSLRYSSFLNAAQHESVGTFFGRYAQIDNYSSKLFDLLNIKYMMVLKRDRGQPSNQGKVSYKFEIPKFKTIFEDKSVAILENTNSLPRAFLVGNFILERDGHEILEKMVDKKFDPSRTIILEEILQVLPVIQDFEHQVMLLNFDVNSEKWSVQTSEEAMLFVSNAYFPGWKAFVDGQETKIYRANYTFRAVHVTKGNHIVRFSYEPLSFKIGALISVVTFGFLSLLLLGLWVKKKELL